MNHQIPQQKDAVIHVSFQVKKPTVHASGFILPEMSIVLVHPDTAHDETFQGIDDMGRAYNLCSDHGWFL